MPTRILALAFAIFLGGQAMTSAQDPATALTVYNEGAALIRDRVALELEAGLNEVVLRDIAATIDPSSVMLRPVDGGERLNVLEQNFLYERSDARALLAPFIDQSVELVDGAGAKVSGQLLRLLDDSAMLRTGENALALVKLHEIQRIVFPSTPDTAIGPALRLLVESASAGESQAALSYLAGGLDWSADYNIFLSDDQRSLDLTGWVTLANRSGRAYEKATLKLVAGDMQRIEQEAQFSEARAMALDMAGSGGGGVAQRELFEYQLYEVGRPVTIADKQTKQIQFVSGAGVPAEILYVFDSSPNYGGYYSPITYVEDYGGSQPVRSFLEFETDAETGLGADLPAGRARVYGSDVDGASLLIGESRVNHIPQGQAVRLGLGAAFDLSGEREHTDFRMMSRLVAREEFEIRLRNHKDDEAVAIIVPERLFRWRDWEIIESSQDFVKVSASTVEFSVTVEPGAEATLYYTVEYSFPPGS